MFQAFFRAIVPHTVVDDMFSHKPGAILARVHSYKYDSRRPYEMRGWNYVHLDEIIEMVIVRLVKGLNVVILPYLETIGSGFW